VYAPLKLLKNEAMQHLARPVLCNSRSSSPPYSPQGSLSLFGYREQPPSPFPPSLTRPGYDIPANHSMYRGCWLWPYNEAGIQLILKRRKRTPNLQKLKAAALYCSTVLQQTILTLTIPNYFL